MVVPKKYPRDIRCMWGWLLRGPHPKGPLPFFLWKKVDFGIPKVGSCQQGETFGGAAKATTVFQGLSSWEPFPK